MLAWLLYSYMLGWGLLLIAIGLGMSRPEMFFARWAVIGLLGLPSLVLGSLGLVLGKRGERIVLDKEKGSKAPCYVLGVSLILGGVLAALHIAPEYPFSE